MATIKRLLTARAQGQCEKCFGRGKLWSLALHAWLTCPACESVTNRS